MTKLSVVRWPSASISSAPVSDRPGASAAYLPSAMAMSVAVPSRSFALRMTMSAAMAALFLLARLRRA